jgi:hypothetical protein
MFAFRAFARGRKWTYVRIADDNRGVVSELQNDFSPFRKTPGTVRRETTDAKPSAIELARTERRNESRGSLLAMPS